MKARALFHSAAAVGIAIVVACAGADITGTGQFDDAGALRTVDGAGARPIQCPTTESSTSSAVVTPLGGLVSVAGTTISIPAGALLSDALVTVTVPASPYMEVDISVQGTEHYVFELPVTVTIGYSRCTRSDIDHTALSAWYIDSQTKRLLQRMPSVDNKVLRTVTFTTEHLSGYAVAN